MTIERQSARVGASCVGREVWHMHYQTGIISRIGLVIERRRRERGTNFLDLLRKARLEYGHGGYDIGAIFLGPIRMRPRRRTTRFRSV